MPALKKNLKLFYRYLQTKGITYWLKWSFITLACVEMIHRASLVSWLGWIFRKPIPALVNYIIILAIFMVFNAIFTRRRTAVLLGFSLLLLLALVDYFKFSLLYSHLYPWDFFVIPEMMTLLPTLTGHLLIISILVLLLIPVLIYFLLMEFKQKQTQLVQRFAMLIMSFVCLAVITTAIPVSFVEKYFNHVNVKWDHNRNNKSNGLLFAFALNMQPLLHVESPVAYSKHVIQQMIKHHELQAFYPLQKPPNVIMVMYEGLFDLTELPITYSVNPLKNLQALQGIHGKSTLLVPTYGGGTANTEFEVLTGLSMKFLPEGTVPYQHYIVQPLPSLPNIFKEKGYATLAIHPYAQDFFNREVVYSYLGFDDYMSFEDWDAPHLVGELVSDQDVVQKIMASANTLKSPYFIFAITMQNHMPFTTPVDADLTVLDNGLSADTHDRLARYSAGAQDADNSILVLIEHFKHSPEPTIIIFFGDHLPALKPVYDETAYFVKSDNPHAKYTVPALFWSNYKQIPPLQGMSTMYLGGYVLEQAGIAPPLQFKLLQQMRQGNEVPQLMNDYQLLQYDMLLGEQYFLEH